MTFNRLNWARSTSWILAFAMAGLTVPGAAHGQSYDITVLDPPGGSPESYASALNNSGQVAGYSMAAGGGHFQAWCREADGAMHLVGPAPGRVGSYAYGFNESGTVVGENRDSSGGSPPSHAYMWTAHGGMIELGTLGGSFSTAFDVNNGNKVVGWADSTGGSRRGFVWDNGVMHEVPTFGGRSPATAINSSCLVVGFSSSSGMSGDQHAYLWQYPTDTELTNLGTLGGTASEAWDVNDSAQIVGWAYNSSNNSRAFLWEDGAMTDLGTLGGTRSVANGINEAGAVAGWAYTSNGEQHACLWEDGLLIDLNDLDITGLESGWTLTSAMDVNDLGHIVGYATDPGGAQYGFLLVPEPGTLALLTIGGLLALRRRR